jgi:hypothetical protein
MLKTSHRLKNADFRDVSAFVSCKNRRFGGTHRLHHKDFRHVLRLLVTANVPSSPILVSLMMEATCSSETSVLRRTTHHNIPEDDILHSHRSENLESYTALTGWAL